MSINCGGKSLNLSVTPVGKYLMFFFLCLRFASTVLMPIDNGNSVALVKIIQPKKRFIYCASHPDFYMAD